MMRMGNISTRVGFIMMTSALLSRGISAADTVVAAIEKITGWGTTDGSTGNAGGKLSAGPTTRFRVARTNGNITRISAEPGLSHHAITVFSANGRIAKRLRLYQPGTCDWNTAHAVKGLYLLGGSESGWVRVFVN